MSLERFCREPVVTIQPTQSVRDAALLMRDRHVGAVLVVDDDRPVGIVTDRDIVMRAIIEGRDPNTTPVRDVMSGSLTVVSQRPEDRRRRHRDPHGGRTAPADRERRRKGDRDRDAGRPGRADGG